MRLQPAAVIQPAFVVGPEAIEEPVVDTEVEYLATRLYLSKQAARQAGAEVGMIPPETHRQALDRIAELEGELADTREQLEARGELTAAAKRVVKAISQ